MSQLPPLILFKNASIIRWLEAKQIKGELRGHVGPQDVAHRHVFGHVPTWLASFADQISELSLPSLSREGRERFNRGELSIEEMDTAGAHIVTYKVRKVL